MTTLYNIQPNFVWAFLDNNGLPASGGKIYTWEAEDHDTPKPVYQDEAGNTPWPNPITLDASGKQDYNGTFYPIYWADDAPYFVQIKDSDGNIIAEMDFYPSDNANQPVITEVDIENYIINGQLYFDCGRDFVSGGNVVHGFEFLPASTNTLIAPDAWYFDKNNTTATDQLLITDYIAGITNPPNNPKAAFNYVCTAPGTGETYKIIFYKFNSSRMFAGETINLQFSASATFSSSLSISIMQNFGTGGSSQVVSNIASISLTTTPTDQEVLINVPSISGKTIGTDDYFAIEFGFPLDEVCNITISDFFVRMGSTFVPPQEESVNITQAQVIANQYPIVEQINDPNDGNYYPVFIKGSGIAWQSMAGKIIEAGYNFANDWQGLYCNGSAVFSTDYYNLANAIQTAWGIGTSGFTTSVALEVITATCFTNGAVSAGSAGTSPFTFVQTDPGSGGTPGIATITCTTLAATNQGQYFLINAPGQEYYVWFSYNNQTQDPGSLTALTGKKGIKVIYDGAETDAQIAALVATQLNVANILLPDHRGVVPRGRDNGRGLDPDVGSRTASGSGGATGDNVGSYQSDAFRSHTHTYEFGTNGAGPQPPAGDNPVGGTYTTNASGGNETRPVNEYVDYLILY